MRQENNFLRMGKIRRNKAKDREIKNLLSTLLKKDKHGEPRTGLPNEA